MAIRIKVPRELARPVSEKAARYARNEAMRRNWSPRSYNSYEPVVGDGFVGVRTTAEHLIYQEHGTRPFLMKSLEGKRVPIDGRIVTAKGVGQPGFVHIPRPGLPDQVIWRNQKWRHPGIKPQNIMKNAISRAILEDQKSVRDEIVRRLRGRR